MSTEIVRAQPAAPAHYDPNVLSAQMEYAKAMASSDLLPRQYQGKPANLLWAISYGQTLGVAPLTAVQSIHVINGKPTASADLIAGLVRRAGHKLRVNGDDRRAVAQIIRADDPDFTFEVVWTIERAQAAKLTGKDTWKNFPAAMLKARAITEVARAACSEILQGTIYTPEELGANVDADGIPVEAPVQQLRRVQPGEADPWATPAPQGVAVIDPGVFKPYQPAQELAEKAAKAASRDALTALRDEAQQANVSADAGILAPDTEKPDTLREYLKRRWAVLPKPGEETAGQDADGVVEGEVIETPAEDTDDYAAAVAELRAAAEAANLDDFENGATQALGCPITEASTEAIRALAAQIRPAA